MLWRWEYQTRHKAGKGDKVFLGGDDAMYRHAGSICRRTVLVLLSALVVLGVSSGSADFS